MTFIVEQKGPQSCRVPVVHMITFIRILFYWGLGSVTVYIKRK